jgi:glycopeptide antibiotics resistance protein
MSCRFGNINNYVYTLFKTWMSKVIRISKKLISFWSWYTGIILDDKLLLEQNVLNCLMLAPMGFLLPRIADRKVKLPYAFLVGVAVAVVIEGCQLM